ncbi:hypothetical protein E4U41_003746 [Claviceps citrina]|nr:hypothetical protein E4U41_003746 [Claviceps citrina]
MAPPTTGQQVPAPERENGESIREDEDAEPQMVRFSPEEEAALLAESNSIKAEANTLYSAKDYDNALSRYQDALSTCPNYLHYDRSVLQSNMAACHLQQEQWKEAIRAATGALDGLATLEKELASAGASGNKDGPKQGHGVPEAQEKKEKSSSAASPPRADDDEIEEEVVSAGAARAAPGPSSPPNDDDDTSAATSAASSAAERRRADMDRIRTKALLRRARARAEAGGWQNLARAEEDYKLLSGMTGLGAADLRTVRRQLLALPARTKLAQEAEMSEMWGKLRTLGDGILKPFGLSTSNFQMVKDEKSGGYSMNFTSADGSSKK